MEKLSKKEIVNNVFRVNTVEDLLYEIENLKALEVLAKFRKCMNIYAAQFQDNELNNKSQ